MLILPVIFYDNHALKVFDLRYRGILSILILLSLSAL